MYTCSKNKQDYFGFLNIYKPAGMTSHDVVYKIRKISGIKQVGHTGTLDPFAEGVLPVCLGKATRLIEYLTDDKEYLATVQFGKSTATYDLEGEVTNISAFKVNENDILTALKKFEGEIEQLPPIYSAIKVNGKKLYDYARKGQDVEIKPRKVFIEKIELKSFDYENQSAEILIKCSKGTYIRSIAHDLGKITGAYAYLTKLTRTQAGKFIINDAIKLDEIENNFSTGMLINPLDVIELPQINVKEEELEKIHNGQFLQNFGEKNGQPVILIYNNCVICAVGAAEDNKIKLKNVFI